MKLEQLNLDIAGVVSAPLKRTTPEPEWITAKESAVIPTELFRLYEAAGFLSFGLGRRGHMFRICSSVALVMMMGAPVRADVLIIETTYANAGNRKVDGVRTIYIKGAHMRLEVVQADGSTTTLYDVPGGTTSTLDAKKKRAELRDTSARNAELERQ